MITLENILLIMGVTQLGVNIVILIALWAIYQRL